MFFEFVVAILILFCAFLAHLIYSGLLTTIIVKVGRPNFSAGTFFYKFYQINYRHVGQAFREMEKFPVKDKILIGIYYDDPKKVNFTLLLVFVTFLSSVNIYMVTQITRGARPRINPYGTG